MTVYERPPASPTRGWFDIAVVYNNRRAILSIDKGAPGERVFANALNAWTQ